MLHNIVGCPKGRVQWCGPSAISAITGVDYLTAVERLKEERMHRGHSGERLIIKGVSHSLMLATLRRMGYDARPLFPAEGETFAAWLRGRSAEVRQSVVLVNAGHHYLVAQGYRAVDNHTKAPTFISKMPHRRKRMAAAWVVTKSPPRRVAWEIYRVRASGEVILGSVQATSQPDALLAGYREFALYTSAKQKGVGARRREV